jgi:hypothetical protein
MSLIVQRQLTFFTCWEDKWKQLSETACCVYTKEFVDQMCFFNRRFYSRNFQETIDDKP